MAMKGSKADPHPFSSDGDATPGSRDRSRSPDLYSDEANRVEPPVPYPDLMNKLRTWFNKRCMQELLPSTSDLGRRRKGRRPQQSNDKSDWEDLSDDPQSSEDDTEQEVFVAP